MAHERAVRRLIFVGLVALALVGGAIPAWAATVTPGADVGTPTNVEALVDSVTNRYLCAEAARGPSVQFPNQTSATEWPACSTVVVPASDICVMSQTAGSIPCRDTDGRISTADEHIGTVVAGPNVGLAVGTSTQTSVSGSATYTVSALPYPVVCPVGMNCAGKTDSTTSTSTASGTGTFYATSTVPITLTPTDTRTNVMQGTGTTNYVVKKTASGWGDSQIRDDGSSVSIAVAPIAGVRFAVQGVTRFKSSGTVRSDIASDATHVAVNAYDDGAATYMPWEVDASTFSFKVNGVTNGIVCSSTGCAVSGTLSLNGASSGAVGVQANPVAGSASYVFPLSVSGGLVYVTQSGTSTGTTTQTGSGTIIGLSNTMTGTTTSTVTATVTNTLYAGNGIGFLAGTTTTTSAAVNSNPTVVNTATSTFTTTTKGVWPQVSSGLVTAVVTGTASDLGALSTSVKVSMSGCTATYHTGTGTGTATDTATSTSVAVGSDPTWTCTTSGIGAVAGTGTLTGTTNYLPKKNASGWGDSQIQDNGSGVGVGMSPVAGVTLAVQGASRVKGSGTVRSDISVDSTHVAVNSYDDGGGAYAPYEVDASTFTVKSNGTSNTLVCNSSGVSVVGTLSASGTVSGTNLTAAGHASQDCKSDGTNCPSISTLGGVPSTRTITTTNGLQGGGDLSADRTLSPVYGSTSNTVAQGNDTRIVNAVQTSRQVCGHALSADVSCTAADVGSPSGSGTISGTTNYLTKKTAAGWGDSQIQDDGAGVGVGAAPISGVKMAVQGVLRVKSSGTTRSDISMDAAHVAVNSYNDGTSSYLPYEVDASTFTFKTNGTTNTLVCGSTGVSISGTMSSSGNASANGSLLCQQNGGNCPSAGTLGGLVPNGVNCSGTNVVNATNGQITSCSTVAYCQSNGVNCPSNSGIICSGTCSNTYLAKFTSSTGVTQATPDSDYLVPNGTSTSGNTALVTSSSGGKLTGVATLNSSHVTGALGYTPLADPASGCNPGYVLSSATPPTTTCVHDISGHASEDCKNDGTNCPATSSGDCHSDGTNCPSHVSGDSYAIGHTYVTGPGSTQSLTGSSWTTIASAFVNAANVVAHWNVTFATDSAYAYGDFPACITRVTIGGVQQGIGASSSPQGIAGSTQYVAVSGSVYGSASGGQTVALQAGGTAAPSGSPCVVNVNYAALTLEYHN